MLYSLGKLSPNTFNFEGNMLEARSAQDREFITFFTNCTRLCVLSLQAPVQHTWWWAANPISNLVSQLQLWKQLKNTYTCLDAYHHPMMIWSPTKTIIPLCFSQFLLLFSPFGIKVAPPFGWYSFTPCFDPKFSPFGIKSPKKAWQTK